MTITNVFVGPPIFCTKEKRLYFNFITTQSKGRHVTNKDQPAITSLTVSRFIKIGFNKKIQICWQQVAGLLPLHSQDTNVSHVLSVQIELTCLKSLKTVNEEPWNCNWKLRYEWFSGTTDAQKNRSISIYTLYR